jgi:hypothetical protein
MNIRFERLVRKGGEETSAPYMYNVTRAWAVNHNNEPRTDRRRRKRKNEQ